MGESAIGDSLLPFRVCGVSFRRTPVSIRERVSVRPERVGEAVRWLKEQPGVREAMVLSTCNRTEIYLAAEEWVDGSELFVRFARAHRDASLDAQRDGVYEFAGVEAARHLFRVAASLDSLVLGEPQILGQTKEAFRAAESEGGIGRELHLWVSKALAAAKEVRAKTALSRGATSVATAAVELAGRVFETLDSKSVLLLGAGEMGEAAALQLHKAGVSNIAVTSRTLERAREAARKCGGVAIPFEQRLERAVDADVVICSTGADLFVLDAAQVKTLLRRRGARPLLILDISVPRNVDPEVGGMEGVFLFNVDNLEEIVEANRRGRQAEAERAEAIVSRAVAQFLRQLRQGSVGPAIAAVRDHVRSICEEELLRFERANPELTQQERAELELLLHRIAQKILHPIICELKGAGEADRAQADASLGQEPARATERLASTTA